MTNDWSHNWIQEYTVLRASNVEWDGTTGGGGYHAGDTVTVHGVITGP